MSSSHLLSLLLLITLSSLLLINLSETLAEVIETPETNIAPVSGLSIYRLYSTNPGKVRGNIDALLDEIEDNDLEIVAHDESYLYFTKEDPAVDTAAADDDDDIRRQKFHHNSKSMRKLMEFLSRQEFPVKVAQKPQYLGRHGRIPKHFLPTHHMALNNEIPKGYTSPEKLRSHFEKLASAYDFAEWIDFAHKFNDGSSSIEGRPIHALRLNYKPNEKKPAVLFASCHHARELITPEIAIAIADLLTDGFDQKLPSITKWLEEYDIWIIPVVNVDGHEFVWSTNNMWRKNRRPLPKSAFGVDLNRNYDLGWKGQGGSDRFASETYRGSAPFSEPESQAVRALSKALNFAKVMDFHSSGQQVLLHYTRTEMPQIMKDFIGEEGKKLASLAHYGVRSPTDDGEHQEWQIKTNTAYSFLVETGTSFQPAFSQALEEVKRVWPLVVKFLSRPITLTGQVTDESTGAPIPSAKIVVKGIDWKAGESRNSHPSSGYYHLFLPQGDYEIEFSAPGYETRVQKVSIEQNGSSVENIVLSPESSN